MNSDLKNSVIAITGAGSGVGRCLALECAKRGSSVAISDINLPNLKVTLAKIDTLYPQTRVIVHELDIANKEAVFQWADDVVAYFGTVNVIINSAGVGLAASVESTTYEDFEWLMNINFWGAVHGCKGFLPHLKKSSWGHIVNVSSLFGLVGTPNTSAYNSAKFALRGFSESLRIELMMSQKKIDVSCVHPRGIKTNIANNSRNGAGKMGLDARLSEQERKINFNENMAKTTPQQAAKKIVNGIIKKQPRILVGPDAKVFDMLQRLLPVKYQNVVARVFG